MKVYVVSGKDFLDRPISVRVQAENVKEARKEAAYKVASNAKVMTAANAASKVKR